MNTFVEVTSNIFLICGWTILAALAVGGMAASIWFAYKSLVELWVHRTYGIGINWLSHWGEMALYYRDHEPERFKDLLFRMNKWRNDLGLEPITEADMDKLKLG